MRSELQLTDLVQQLRLSGISATLESRLRQARDASMDYEELLTTLLQDELEHTEKQALQRRIETAKFEELKTLTNFTKEVTTHQLESNHQHEHRSIS
jgi:hypothetical protein